MIKRIFLYKSPKFLLQYQLSYLVTFFLFLNALTLTLSPAVKYRSWNVNFLWSHWIGFLIWIISFFYLNFLATNFLNRHDQFIIPIIGLLTGWGILSIWRIDAFFGFRQSLWFFVSVFTAQFFIKKKDFLFLLKKFKYLLLIFGLTLATLTFFFGTYPGGGGPRLWLGAAGIYFQPSELLKLLLIVYLAAYFSEKDFPDFPILNTILPTLILLFSSLFILVGQRDMGTALIFIVIYVLLVFIAYGKKRIIAMGLGLIIISAIIGYFFIDLIRIRFFAWVLPWLDPQAGSYQIIQSLIAIAAGGLFGSGIGLGSPNIVPIAHSDFIFTTILEETGLLGGIALLIIYGLLLARALMISINASNKYYRFLAAGIGTYLLAQSILIMGGNIRLLPITGVTLPFVSYGGSSLIVSIICACMLLVISHDQEKSIPINLNNQPYTMISIIFALGLILVGAVTGWWSIMRSYDLQHRLDNTRRLSSAQFVKRGSIIDRNNIMITESIGDIGEITRKYHYPPLTNTLGYIHNRYGLTGLELTFDEYLSGEKGYPASFLWFNFLLYDQPPPGVDIRLTVDLKIQEQLDALFSDLKGSGVIINPLNGEILAIASHPHIDANQLDDKFVEWQADENAPFLNRAVQGAYPIGEIIVPFLFDHDLLLDFEMRDPTLITNFFYQGKSYPCAIGQPGTIKWQQAISNGCPSIFLNLPTNNRWESFNHAILQHNLAATPEIGLPSRSQQYISPTNSWFDLLYGENRLRVNPLQIAQSASIFSNHGMRSDLGILFAVNASQKDWIVVFNPKQEQIISPNEANDIMQHLLSDEISGWEITAKNTDSNKSVSWYVAGTPSDWEGQPLIIVIVFENANAEVVQNAGRDLFNILSK